MANKTILVASDSFKGTLSSLDICNLFKEEVKNHKNISLKCLPVADVRLGHKSAASHQTRDLSPHAGGGVDVADDGAQAGRVMCQIEHGDLGGDVADLEFGVRVVLVEGGTDEPLPGRIEDVVADHADLRSPLLLRDLH